MSGGASAPAPDPDRADGRADGERTAGTAATPGTEATPGAGAPRPPAEPAAPGRTHGEFLITSEERDAAERRLRAAVADEVLSLEEFGDRMRLLLAARTRVELHAAVAGLPAESRGSSSRPAEADGGRGAATGSGTAARSPRRARERIREGGSVIAILGSSDLRGRWRPGPSTTAVAVLGEATVDLQGVEYEGDELVISAVSALGTVEIIVPEGVAVDLRGIAVLGERRDLTSGDILPDAPVVRVDGLALLGEVVVRHPSAKERVTLPDDRGAFADRVPLRPVEPGARRRRPGARTASAVRRWAVAALAAVALAVPVGWALSADQVAPAVLGSTTQTISTAGVPAGEELTVGAPLAFGSIRLEVPAGVNVERDGVVLFGSTSCEPCGAQSAADAPTVRVRTVGAFGSVEVTRAGAR